MRMRADMVREAIGQMCDVDRCQISDRGASAQRVLVEAGDDRDANLKCGGGEVAVPGHEREVGRVGSQRGGEMHGVIATQRVLLGEFAGVAGQRPVDTDQHHRVACSLQVADDCAQLGPVDPPAAVRGGERRACLGIDEAAGDALRGSSPDLIGEL